jgi:UDP-N-acetylmuramoyl-tripeptide--D-alanyl-D-alanine ligase
MTFWSARRVAKALGVGYDGPDASFAQVSTDTRTVPRGALFVALAGERFDAHAFLADAVAKGAAGLVVRRGTPAPAGAAVFEVEDTLIALGQLATVRRRAVPGPVVAVTGTNGKTTTRQMLAAALGARWRTHATAGNLNNLVGVPLTLLASPDDADALVIEAGASVPGEIARLRAVIEPSVGVITNVAPGHLEGFGSLDGVLREKLALLDGVVLAVVGPEPPALGEGARRRAGRVVVAGIGDRAAVRPDEWALDPNGAARLTFRGVACRLPVVGRHQVENAMLALAAAEALEVDLEGAARALERITVPSGRCQVLRRGDLVVLHDAYNANPKSMAAALETARAMRGDRPLVVVLGSMLELGPESAALHQETAERVLAVEPSLVAVTGLFIPAFARHRGALGDRLLTADDADALGRLVAARLKGRALVLLKASRGVRLERALPHLLPDDPTPCSITC